MIRFRKNLLWVIFLQVVLLHSCAYAKKKGWELEYRSEKERPKWVTKAQKSDKTYMYFSGTRTGAPTLEEGEVSARKQAIQNLIEYIGQKVTSLYEERKTELQSNVMDQIMTGAGGKAVSAKQIEMYYEKWVNKSDNSAAPRFDVNVLIRYPVAEIERERERQKQENRERVVLAQKSHQEGNIHLARGELNQALDKFAHGIKLLWEVRDFTKVGNLTSESVNSDLNSSLDGIISSLKFSSAGSGQEGVVGEELEEPLTVTAVMQDEKKTILLKSLPLVFRFVEGKGKLDNKVRTDSEGKASCRVYLIEPPPGINIFEVGIDTGALSISGQEWMSIGMGKFLERLSKVRERYTVQSFLPKEKKVIVIRITEKNLGRRVESSVVESELSRLFVEDGFNVKPAGNISKEETELVLQGDDSAMAGVMKKNTGASFIILGTADTEFVGKKITLPDGTEMDFGPSCRASLSVKAIGVKRGKVIASTTEGSIKGFGRTEVEAGIDALKKTSESVGKYLIEQFGK